MMTTEQPTALQNLAYTIEQAAKVASSSRGVLYAEIEKGRLPARKLGRRLLILHHELMAWLMGLPMAEMRKAS